MREYIKKFDSINSADGYIVGDIPFISTIVDGGNLVCKTPYKQLKKSGQQIVKEDADASFVIGWQYAIENGKNANIQNCEGYMSQQYILQEKQRNVEQMYELFLHYQQYWNNFRNSAEYRNYQEEMSYARTAQDRAYVQSKYSQVIAQDNALREYVMNASQTWNDARTEVTNQQKVLQTIENGFNYGKTKL